MQDDYQPNIISVEDEDGKEYMFEELDRIEADDGRYVAMIPLANEAEDFFNEPWELIILKVEEENGETYLTPIEDEDEFNEIGQIFEERLTDLYDILEDDEDNDEENE
jgi:uncharacterized protein YrzB (UPF0473 family)